MRPEDIAYCREKIARGSVSFNAASKLLPRDIQDAAIALYAFCRIADDAVDLTQAKTKAVLDLRDRLDRAYSGDPLDQPMDRAFSDMIKTYDMPKALPEALLEGLAWDAEGRRYTTRSELYEYCARVASVVGVMMCVLMGARSRHTLARACDLGLAMQLTNIARDVGEDARAGRIYLPLNWLQKHGLSSDDLIGLRHDTDETRAMVAELLKDADRFYHRATAGISALPLRARTGIYAARYIYAAIGRKIKGGNCNSVFYRFHTSRMEKLGYIGKAGVKSAVSVVSPQSALLHAHPEPELAFLVSAAETQTIWSGRSDRLVALLAQLEERDRQMGGWA